MAPASEITPSGPQHAKDPINTLWRDTLAEGSKELAKRIVQGAVGLTVLSIMVLATLLISIYHFLLEPRLARHIASIITTEQHFTGDSLTKKTRSANPIDDYILKVFLTELSKDRGSRSEYAGRINDALQKGEIREGFRLFYHSIGREIDTLDQIKTIYKYPTTIQFIPVTFEVSEKPGSVYLT